MGLRRILHLDHCCVANFSNDGTGLALLSSSGLRGGASEYAFTSHKSRKLSGFTTHLHDTFFATHASTRSSAFAMFSIELAIEKRR